MELLLQSECRMALAYNDLRLKDVGAFEAQTFF
jgi:hypothetical protein